MKKIYFFATTYTVPQEIGEATYFDDAMTVINAHVTNFGTFDPEIGTYTWGSIGGDGGSITLTIQKLPSR